MTASPMPAAGEPAGAAARGQAPRDGREAAAVGRGVEGRDEGVAGRSADRPRRRTGVDWLLNSLAAAIAGFALAIALSGLFAWLGPGGLAPVNKYQFNMWIVPPLWLVIASITLNVSRGWRAWAWLGAVNLLAWGTLLAVQVTAR